MNGRCCEEWKCHNFRKKSSEIFCGVLSKACLPIAPVVTLPCSELIQKAAPILDYASQVMLMLLNPGVYCIKSHGVGKEETLAVATVQVLDIG